MTLRQRDLREMDREEGFSGKEIFTKRDLVLTLCLLLAAGLLFWAMRTGKESGEAYVRVTADGKVRGEYPLWEDAEFVVYAGGGFNRIVINEGQVFVTEADCPDLCCVRQTPVRRRNEVIVCLPHRVAAEIIEPDSSGRKAEGAEQNVQGETGEPEIDAYTR